MALLSDKPRGSVAEWLACRFMDLWIAGSNPGGVTISTRNNMEYVFTQIYSGQLSLSSFRGR